MASSGLRGHLDAHVMQKVIQPLTHIKNSKSTDKGGKPVWLCFLEKCGQETLQGLTLRGVQRGCCPAALGGASWKIPFTEKSQVD